MERFHIGMVLGFGQDTRNDPALFGDPQAFFGAKRFDINASGHGKLGVK